MLENNFYANQLKKLNSDKKLELNASFAKICCPFHNNGKERTPSLKINLVRDKFKAGSYVCFACNAHSKNWDDLAKVLHLKTKTSGQSESDLNISNEMRNKLFGNSEILDDFSIEERKMDKAIENSKLWPSKDEWRSISGKILRKVEARSIATEYGPKLYLPAFVNKQFKGGITCRLYKAKSSKSPSYIYDSGSWITNTVYPYDYTKNLLSKTNSKVLFYVEGPRDVLNPLQYNIPTLANLGGTTVWSEEKAELILALKPKLLIIATDPDLIGNLLAEKIKTSLGSFLNTKRLKFPDKKNGDKMDPGDTPKARWLHLKKVLDIGEIQ